MFGAAAAHAQYAPGLSPIETAKPWSVSASVRGFYDNNYLTLPSIIPGPDGTFIHGKRDSYGVEVTPSFSFNHSTADTLISASYVYDLVWYEDRLGTTDQSHDFTASLQHEFSERYKLGLTETFVVAQEPTVLEPTVISAPLRTAGSNVRNTATADLNVEATKLLDVHVAYGNTFYAYQENAGDEAVPNSFPSYSALLDRMDQTGTLDLRLKVLPQTTGIVGYQFEHLNYTSPEDIIYAPGPVGSAEALDGVGHFVASVRNNDSHFMYVGVDQKFSSKLSASLRAGAEYLDYYNFGTHSLSPYVDASVTYAYQAQASAQLGVRHTHNATDVAGVIGSTPVLDEESTAAYFSVTHQVGDWTLGLMGQAQFSTFNGGGNINGEEEDFYILNLNIAYHFSPWLSAELGDSYSKLNSELNDRGYSRDIVYIGLRATY
jgi:hypothetical protein